MTREEKIAKLRAKNIAVFDDGPGAPLVELGNTLYEIGEDGVLVVVSETEFKDERG